MVRFLTQASQIKPFAYVSQEKPDSLTKGILFRWPGSKKGNMNAVIMRIALAMTFSVSAMAVSIVIGSGDPGNSGTDDVLFNDGSLWHSGTLVQGNFANEGLGFIVDFTSSSGNGQIQGSSAQAEVKGLSGNNPFTSLTFGLEAGATFQKAIFNVEATVDGHMTIAVSYIDAAGSPYEELVLLDADGQNFYNVAAGDGARITQIEVSTLDSAFASARQFRLGGFEAAQIPDAGSTALLLGLSMFGVVLVRRNLCNE